jgi:hypothetical protein
MSSPVLVQHAILTRLVRQHSDRSVFDLLEVSYDYAVPADTEFPREVPQLDLFLRLIATDAGPTQLQVRLYHVNPRGELDLRKGWFDATRPLPFPEVGRVCLDRTFRLINVSLGGPGLHAIAVYFRPVPDASAAESGEPEWNPDEDETVYDIPGWQTGAVEYFNVVRP